MAAAADAAARAAELSWYHSMTLAEGVETEGFFDTRPTVARVGLPDRLDGLRCLDVGTWDGFWAFEMERRGAASVTAIDIDDPTRWDWPPHTRLRSADARGLEYLRQFKSGAAAFEFAREVLDSRVERVDCSVYDLDSAVHGRFDMVFVGSLLLHLRDPVLALDRVRSVCGGSAIVADAVELVPSLLRPGTPSVRLAGLDQPWWWQPNAAALERMMWSAGFEVLWRSGLYFLPKGPAHPRPPLRQAWRELGTAAAASGWSSG